jgi:hypothetical protein
VTEQTHRKLTLIGAVALGVAIRAVDFLNCRSLALDEARLAVNIASRSFLGLLKPLGMDQSAPPLFLWGERVLFLLGGYSECVLRFLPVVAGVLAAMLMYPLAQRFLVEQEARLAALVGTFCPLLITYSNVVKQYSMELLVTLSLVLVFERALEKEFGRCTFVTLLLAGALAPWLSLTSAFVLAVAWVLLVTEAVRGRPRALRLTVAASVVWAASGVVAYLAVYRAAAGNPYMQHFWELAFIRPGRPGFLTHTWKSFEDLVWGFIAGDFLIDRRPFLLVLHVATATVAALCVAGVFRLSREWSWSTTSWLWGPAVMAFTASALGLFPIAPRLTLFMLPGLIILVMAGLDDGLARIGGWVGRHRVGAMIVCIVLPLEFQAVVRTFALEPSGQFRQMVAELRARRRPDESVYVFARSLPAWIYYSTDWARPDTARLRYLVGAASSHGFAFENAPTRGRVKAHEVEQAAPAPQAPGELLGLPSGMEWREVEEHVGAQPDSGWVEAEERRIQAAARPGVWVLATTYYEPETRLFEALERDATRRTYARLRPGSALVRYEFPPRTPAK